MIGKLTGDEACDHIDEAWSIVNLGPSFIKRSLNEAPKQNEAL